MADPKKKAQRLAHRKGKTHHVTTTGQIVNDREARRRKLKKGDLAYSASVDDDGELED